MSIEIKQTQQENPHDIFFWMNKSTEELAREFKEMFEKSLNATSGEQLQNIESAKMMVDEYTVRLSNERSNLEIYGASSEQINIAQQKYLNGLANVTAMMERFASAKKHIGTHNLCVDTAIEYQNYSVDSVSSDLDERGDSEKRKQLVKLAELGKKFRRPDQIIDALNRILDEKVTEDPKLLCDAAIQLFETKLTQKDQFDQNETYQKVIDYLQELIVKNQTMQKLGNSQWTDGDRNVCEKNLKTNLFKLYASMPYIAFRSEDVAFLEKKDIQKVVNSNPALSLKFTRVKASHRA